MSIIDVSNTLPQFQFGTVDAIEEKNRDYIQLFAPRWANLAGWGKNEFQKRLQNNSLENVLKQLFSELDEIYSFDKFRTLLKESNVTYHAIHNLDYGRTRDEAPVDHEEVTQILAEYPEEFIGFAGFNPHKKGSLQVVRQALIAQNYKAVVIAPYDHGISADDRRYYPLYALCEELDVPIWIHSSINYFKETSVFIDHPKHLEGPLMDFEQLKIIAGHGGWPWVEDMVALLLKYTNLYVDTSAFRPKYISKPHTGWSLFLHYANTLLQDQIVFGSDWLTLGLPIKDFLAEVDDWPLKPEVREKFYYKNAARLFKLPLD